jgi:hypothetical protein
MLSKALLSSRALLFGAASIALRGADALMLEPRWLEVEHSVIALSEAGAWAGAELALLTLKVDWWRLFPKDRGIAGTRRREGQGSDGIAKMSAEGWAN